MRVDGVWMWVYAGRKRVEATQVVGYLLSLGDFGAAGGGEAQVRAVSSLGQTTLLLLFCLLNSLPSLRSWWQRDSWWR